MLINTVPGCETQVQLFVCSVFSMGESNASQRYQQTTLNLRINYIICVLAKLVGALLCHNIDPDSNLIKHIVKRI